MKDAGVQFHKGVPESHHLKAWFSKCKLLVFDDLMTEGGEDKEVLDFFTKHSHHVVLMLRHVSTWEICLDYYMASSVSRQDEPNRAL